MPCAVWWALAAGALDECGTAQDKLHAFCLLTAFKLTLLLPCWRTWGAWQLCFCLAYLHRFSSLLIADIQQLETHLKNKRLREQEARDPLLNQLRQLAGSLQSTTEQLASSVAASVHTELQHQLHVIVGK